MKDIIRWFKFYKTFDGKKPNVIAFNDKVLSEVRALEVIHENNVHWRDLREVLKKPEKFSGEYGTKLAELATKFHMQ